MCHNADTTQSSARSSELTHVDLMTFQESDSSIAALHAQQVVV
jgi:hypothetical protein